MTLLDLFIPRTFRRLVGRPPRPVRVAGLTPVQDDLLRLLTQGWTVWPDADWDRIRAVSPVARRPRGVDPRDLDALRQRNLVAWTDPADRGSSQNRFGFATAEGHRAVARGLLSRPIGGRR